MKENSKQSTDSQSSSRRDFVKVGLTGAMGLTLGKQVSGTDRKRPGPQSSIPFNPRTQTAMPTRNLGKTGYKVGIFSLGGQATIEQPNKEKESIDIINRAIDLGVNYIDSAAIYGGRDQWSQKYIGKVMKDRRKEVFLTSKTHVPTYDESMKLLEQSLAQLNTDHLDLWQLHRIETTEQLDQLFAQNGAIHALEKAKSEGMVRYLGITGHSDPHALVDGIKRFDFDTILMAVNAADRHHLSFIEHLLPLAVEKQMGIIGMKVPARGRILSSWTPPPPNPQRPNQRPERSGTITMKEALDYVLSLPVSTVVIGCDNVAQVEENVQIARNFNPLPETTMANLVARTEEIKRQALAFRRWPRQG